MDKVAVDIKKNRTENVYLFYGADSYKRRNYKNMLKKALSSNEMNLAVFEGEGIDLNRLFDVCAAVPFFAPKRLVIVENSGFFSAKGPARGAKRTEDELLSIIKSLPETTCLAFFEEEAAKNRKLYKEIQKKGAVCECGYDDAKTVATWLKKGFEKEGKNIENDTVFYLIDRAGTDHELLRKEFDKIISYTAGSDKITREDIDAVCSLSIEAKVYELTDACARKDPALMLEKYYALIENEVHPLILLAALRSQFELLLKICELLCAGLGDAQIASELGKAPYVIRNNKKLLKNFSKEKTEYMIEKIVLTDKKIKNGDTDERTGVELMLIEAAL